MALDAISLVQTIVPLLLAIIFTAISITDVKGIITDKEKSVLAPVWCLIAFICWAGYGIINLYATTLEYLASLAWLYFGIGFIFFPVLFSVALLQNLKVSGDMKERQEMELE